MSKNEDLQLSQLTCEKLGYYVYLLTDPRNNKVFYVGKGKGNRINQHLLGALDDRTNETEKIKRIRDIEKLGLKIKMEILRHELNEGEAFAVESAMIDYLGINNLTNEVSGHHSQDNGLTDLQDLEIKYEAKDAVFDDPVLLININRLYKPKMTPAEIYEVTHGHWRLNRNRLDKYKIVCGVNRGIIREVFIAHSWHPSKQIEGRLYFDGEVAPQEIRDRYIYKKVAKYWQAGSQYPIKYVDDKTKII